MENTAITTTEGDKMLSFEKLAKIWSDDPGKVAKNSDGSFTICAAFVEEIEQDFNKLEAARATGDAKIKRLEKEIEAHIRENLLDVYRAHRRDLFGSGGRYQMKMFKELVGPTLADSLEGLCDMENEGAQEAVENARIGYCDYRGN